MPHKNHSEIFTTVACAEEWADVIMHVGCPKASSTPFLLEQRHLRPYSPFLCLLKAPCTFSLGIPNKSWLREEGTLLVYPWVLLGSAPWGSPKPLGRGAGLAIPSHLPCAVIPSRQAFLLAVAAGTLLTTPQHTAIGAHPVSVPTYRAQGTPTYSYVPPHW